MLDVYIGVFLLLAKYVISVLIPSLPITTNEHTVITEA